MKVKAVSGMTLILLFASMLTLKFSVQPVMPEPYETRLHVRESPPGSWIPGVTVNGWVWVTIDIESPIAWDDTANGIVGYIFYVNVDTSVLEFIGAYAGTFGYFLFDFVDWNGYPPIYYPILDVQEIPPWDDTRVSELIPSGLGVGAGGNSGTPGWHGETYGLCRLRFRSKSETAHTLIDIYDAVWIDTNGTQHAFDVVDDGHYNQPSGPSVPEFPLGLALEILFIPVIIYILWMNKQREKVLP